MGISVMAICLHASLLDTLALPIQQLRQNLNSDLSAAFPLKHCPVRRFYLFESPMHLSLGCHGTCRRKTQQMDQPARQR